ncbi:MAG: N-6 DNA methylase [Bacteroidota bacterium]
MLTHLDLQEGDYVLEPCGGDGVFIEPILEKNASQSIDIYELNELAFFGLKKKFGGYINTQFSFADTLTDTNLDFKSSTGGFYDKIIANPPYGAWIDYEERKNLKKLYPGLYVKETYSLFLYRCVQLLKEGGRLVFIIPDTFLNLHMHSSLRAFFLTNTVIKEIALFPSNFFPNVNFGYANLSILVLERCSDEAKCLDNEFLVTTGFAKVEDLNTSDGHTKRYCFTQREVFNNQDHALFIADNQEVTRLLNHSDTRIGDIASCVTGFYSGNDKDFLKVLSKDVRNGKKYDVLDRETLFLGELNGQGTIGLKGEKHFVPIVKGGNTKYLKPNHWFMDWSVDSVGHYKKCKKARFQNSQFYFQNGIGVPMVSSSQITASLIEGRLFDQSIVGVFPHNQKLMWYLLAFFNTPTCNTLIRTINPSANNPANYIKKIPVIIPDDKLIDKINKLTKRIVESVRETGTYNQEQAGELQSIFIEIYGF